MIPDQQIERACAHFLHREAELLDRRRFEDWLALLSAAIDYRVPVRTTRQNKDGDGFSTSAFLMKEDFGTLKLRVARLQSEFAWAENPATRTRRLIANIRIGPGSADEQPVTSNFAVYCFRGDATVPAILTGERQDVLAREDGAYKLKTRLVLLDSTVLGLPALSIFL